jgi:hypothetical protein
MRLICRALPIVGVCSLLESIEGHPGQDVADCVAKQPGALELTQPKGAQSATAASAVHRGMPCTS